MLIKDIKPGDLIKINSTYGLLEVWPTITSKNNIGSIYPNDVLIFVIALTSRRLVYKYSNIDKILCAYIVTSNGVLGWIDLWHNDDRIDLVSRLKHGDIHGHR